jgi:O-antigen/teichoic acid export membrane protein
MSNAPHDPRDLAFSVENQEKNLSQRTGKSALGVLVYSALKLVLALGTTAILARMIPPSSHGLVALAVPAVLVATGLSDFGLAQAITQKRHVTHALASSLFWINVILGATLTITIFLLGIPAAWFYDAPDVVWVFFALSPYVFLTVLTTQYIAMLRRQMKIVIIERAVFAATLISTAVALFLAWLGFGVAALVAQLLVQQALTFVILVIVTRWRPSGLNVLRTTPLRDALSFGSYLAAERLLNNLTRNLQLTLVGWAFGQSAAGLYYRAETIAVMPERRVVSPLSAAFLPALSRLQDDAEGMRRMIQLQSSRTNILIVPIGAILVCCPDFVVSVLLGPAWEGAQPIMRLLGVLTAAALLNNLLVWVMVASGSGRELFRGRVVIAALSAAAIIAASPFGLLPMTAAYVLANSVIPLVVMGLCVGHFTPVGLKTVRNCLVELGLWFGVLTGVGLTVRGMLGFPPWVEFVVVAIIFVTAIVMRAFIDRSLRDSVIRIVRRTL